MRTSGSLPPAWTSTRPWYRELASLIFGGGNLAFPATALAMCFAAGVWAGYTFNEQNIDSTAYETMASLFTYLNRT
ncbi:hypothetical protein [Breoghania sp.]|uniref:hypothetical protein n=1 Tax=Breoghania sp. TaxID=2065378 RepID=UPI00261DDDC1|nr:hypothetical protein [Breoghania sp.]MDJ0932516.1 hypothetical protein [Breoghania sp.]